jgi:hypothetical protein
MTLNGLCWLAKPLNYGTMVPSSSPLSDPGFGVRKWCYNDSEAYCTQYGALYNWPAALNIPQAYVGGTYTVASVPQGICPSGWRLPTSANMPGSFNFSSLFDLTYMPGYTIGGGGTGEPGFLYLWLGNVGTSGGCVTGTRTNNGFMTFWCFGKGPGFSVRCVK